jgi:putative metalloenzyme radical SAM/SPASM domain maturase
MKKSWNKRELNMESPAVGMSSKKENSKSVTAPPLKVFLEVTTKCNLTCSMCVRQNGEGYIREGNLQSNIFKALEPAFPYLDTLILNGIGEPLLHPKLEEFIRRAKKLMPGSAVVGFQSNGILLNEATARSLIDAGLNRICLSVDTVSHDSFPKIRTGGELRDIDRAFTALNTARKLSGRQDFRTGVEIVLMRDTLLELPATIRWAAQRGASFAIVTQLLPYSKSLIDQAAYDTNTHDAISIFKRWKKMAEDEGLDIKRYFEMFLKYWKNSDEERITCIIEKMKSDAGALNIALHLERLLRRDEEWFRTVERVYEEVGVIADEEGIDVKLPETAPRNSRHCEFVENSSVFVSWNGDVHPCFFLWHRYSCYVGGLKKSVNPWVFGSLSEMDILDIWNLSEFRSFRESVLRYDFPFCFDCSFALCNYVEGEDFEQDCYISSVPCGACLWCTGLFHCLQ